MQRKSVVDGREREKKRSTPFEEKGDWGKRQSERFTGVSSEEVSGLWGISTGDL